MTMIEKIARKLGYVPEHESDERVRLAEIAVIREQNMRAAVEDEIAELRAAPSCACHAFDNVINLNHQIQNVWKRMPV